jgi:hypothetical protein
MYLISYYFHGNKAVCLVVHCLHHRAKRALVELKMNF